MRPREKPVFVEVHRGGSGWLDETSTVESGSSTLERTVLGLRMGVLWAVSACMFQSRFARRWDECDE